ncbi:MAG: type II secretion system protein [Verrucomicrobiales bacterium]|nr:type II secretion system protein [Verrucomicrobiales bacterium]
MKRNRYGQSGFSLLELLMAMAVFAIAAVSLAQAINLISLTVVESIDDGELRERLRGELLAASRDPFIKAETRLTPPNGDGIFFRIETTKMNAENRQGISLEDLYEVRVTALRQLTGEAEEELDSASTASFSGIF